MILIAVALMACESVWPTPRDAGTDPVQEPDAVVTADATYEPPTDPDAPKDTGCPGGT